MSSYEDRIRAVELYIKLGKRVRPTIRQLGYPTKNSLKGWYNEYQQKLDLPAGYAGRRPKFSHYSPGGPISRPPLNTWSSERATANKASRPL
ncbi:hypothetical protein SAMN05518854_11522 [Variovorax sp. YR266]|nr:hypothetical protein SAMN05518854_11522 [Variovorax sp. YR266]